MAERHPDGALSVVAVVIWALQVAQSIHSTTFHSQFMCYLAVAQFIYILDFIRSFVPLPVIVHFAKITTPTEKPQ